MILRVSLLFSLLLLLLDVVDVVVVGCYSSLFDWLKIDRNGLAVATLVYIYSILINNASTQNSSIKIYMLLLWCCIFHTCTVINTNVYFYASVCLYVRQKITVNLYVISVTTKRIINFPTTTTNIFH